MQEEVKRIYNDLLSSLNKLIPENWEKIYFYASIIEGKKGEMYFYYFPKKIIKAKPVNCYEIPNKFGIDEKIYNEALAKVYEKIKKIKRITREVWTNVTIIIDKKLFTIEYHYNNLVHSMYTDEQRHLVWNYKYLGLPYDSLNKEEQNLVTHYEEESSFKPTIVVENIEKLKSIKAREKNQVNKTHNFSTK